MKIKNIRNSNSTIPLAIKHSAHRKHHYFGDFSSRTSSSFKMAFLFLVCYAYNHQVITVEVLEILLETSIKPSFCLLGILKQQYCNQTPHIY